MVENAVFAVLLRVTLFHLLWGLFATFRAPSDPGSSILEENYPITVSEYFTACEARERKDLHYKRLKIL